LTGLGSRNRIQSTEKIRDKCETPMRAELIYNPSGGQVAVRHQLDGVVAFLQRHGWSVAVRETGAPLQATELARQAVSRGAEIVVAAGGDGTISEVANGLADTEAALGVLPVGTTNSWALQMGIPALNPMLPGAQVAKMVSSLEEKMARPLPANYYRKLLLDAARVLLEGRTVVVDMGELSDRRFLMWTGIGFDATVVRSVSLKDKKRLGSWAYVLPALQAARLYSDTKVRLNLDGKVVNVNTPFIVISNIQLYGGGLEIGPRARINDGRLDVCIFKGGGFFTFVNQAMKVLTHRHLQDPMVEYYQCHEIVVESARPLPVHVDGETFGTTPVAIRTVPSSLKVIVPQDVPTQLFSRDAF
jgi:diacylglycerol kinase (ATP)